MTPETKSPIREKLQEHFGNRPPEDVVTTTRAYAYASRLDLQLAIEAFFEKRPQPVQLGILGTGFLGDVSMSLPQLFSRGLFDIGPLQHDDVDTGGPEPTRCLKNALWLSADSGLPFALLLTTTRRGGASGINLELALPKGGESMLFSQNFFRDLETRVDRAETYRGKVLSIENPRTPFSTENASLKVHHLRTVQREEVILPEKTLRLLDHNVMGFIDARRHLKTLGLSGKKGLLFYGPPGTGKTHTIHYLAHLVGHTTLLITSEQVGMLDEYFRLARLLQPSLVVVEDVDLIARSRDPMGNPGREILLNKLLNEMDGLREDADILFILTTNRPGHLEPSLAARPGRIDQAIEFPLPDEQCRARLIRLYARGLQLEKELLDSIVRKTRGASAAFIKELMRRAAQFQLEFSLNGSLDQTALDAALEEIVFSGGSLNLKLLGGGKLEIGFTGKET